MENLTRKSQCEALMSFSELSSALGARLLTGEGKQQAELCSAAGQSSAGFEGFSSVCIDSRAVKAGALFVALKGAALDGHRFINAAFKAGARGALVNLSAMEDPDLDILGIAQKRNCTIIAVEDTLKGLQKASAAYLERFPRLVKIGITGSAGKTTTKEIAAAILRQEKSVVMSMGNLNSETGLPLSVFDVRSHHELGVFEAAMNQKGEMIDLAKILKPDFALITNIGTAHIGILGSREAIAEEKKQIFSQFTGNNTAMIPEKDDFRDFLSQGVNGRIVFYGASSLRGLDGVKDLGLEGTEIVFEGEAVRFGLPGKANLLNALAAVALAQELGLSAASIRKGLSSVKPLFGRGEILYGRTTLIRDCYNCSPESAMEALDFCDSLESVLPIEADKDNPATFRVYVMGSMLELGSLSDEAHVRLGERLNESRADMIFLYGEEMAAAADVLKTSGKAHFYTCDKLKLSAELDKYLKNKEANFGSLAAKAKHDQASSPILVLLKGARGCELETLSEMLLGKSFGGDNVF